MTKMVEQFRAGGWNLVSHWPTMDEAKAAMQRYQANNPQGRFRVVAGRLPPIKEPMAH